jgi:hypothetical protein
MTLHSYEQPLSVDALVEQVSRAPYVSRTRVGRDLARAAAAGLLSAEDVDAVRTAALARRRELIASHSEPTPDDVPLQEGAAEWSPSAVLDRMDTTPHEPDHMERQLPNGDRD